MAFAAGPAATRQATTTGSGLAHDRLCERWEQDPPPWQMQPPDDERNRQQVDAQPDEGSHQ
jgi:hypothetical protein